MTNCLRIAFLVFAWLVGPVATMAKPAASTKNNEVPGRLTLEELFRPQAVGSPQLSPDGSHLAAIVTDEKDNSHLRLLNAETLTSHQISGGGSIDVYSFRWMDDDRLVFNVSAHRLYAYGLYAVERADTAKNFPILSSDVTKIIGAPHSRPGHLLLWVQRSASKEGKDGGLVEIDTRNRAHWTDDGYRSLVRTYPGPKAKGAIINWLADFDGELTACLTYADGRLRWQKYMRDGSGWRQLPFDVEVINPLRIDPDGVHVWVSDHRSGQGYLLRRYHLETGRFEAPVATDERYDFANAVFHFSRVNRELLGISYHQQRLKNIWFSEALREAQAKLDQAMPTTDNQVVDLADDENSLLILSASPRQPGAYLLYDRRANKLRPLFHVAPWLRNRPLRASFALNFTTRDGVTLEGYLTMPAGASKQNPPPLVVRPHGGPYVRDTWSFDPEVQFLASRGYAVLQPNYRGSTGYSPEISRDDRSNFRRMHDDVTDATREMIKSGLVDPQRIAIMGASFGGYLALAGVAFEPELYRCAIPVCGVFDWRAFIGDKQEGGRPGEYERLVDLLGSPTGDQARFEAISPLKHTAAIRVPVLIAHGRDDSVVSVSQSKKLAAELRKRKVPHETFFRAVEGHGFYSYKTRLEFYQNVERFLDRHMAVVE